MLAGSTTGAHWSRTRRISACLTPHALRGTGTKVAPGHRRAAREIGSPARSPKARASYEAEQTTPRLLARPPTTRRRALPAPSGSTRRATATNIWSQSARRMRRGALTWRSVNGQRSTVNGGRWEDAKTQRRKDAKAEGRTVGPRDGTWWAQAHAKPGLGIDRKSV